MSIVLFDYGARVEVSAIRWSCSTKSEQRQNASYAGSAARSRVGAWPGCSL